MTTRTLCWDRAIPHCFACPHTSPVEHVSCSLLLPSIFLGVRVQNVLSLGVGMFEFGVWGVPIFGLRSVLCDSGSNDFGGWDLRFRV